MSSDPVPLGDEMRVEVKRKERSETSGGERHSGLYISHMPVENKKELL